MSRLRVHNEELTRPFADGVNHADIPLVRLAVSKVADEECNGLLDGRELLGVVQRLCTNHRFGERLGVAGQRVVFVLVGEYLRTQFRLDFRKHLQRKPKGVAVTLPNLRKDDALNAIAHKAWTVAPCGGQPW